MGVAAKVKEKVGKEEEKEKRKKRFGSNSARLVLFPLGQAETSWLI